MLYPDLNAHPKYVVVRCKFPESLVPGSHAYSRTHDLERAPTRLSQTYAGI